jgi:uncharacterized protein (TIGR02172 family)
VDGLDVIGQGFYGTVYRIDNETIVKVYKGEDSIPLIENEKKIAQKAFVAGIPTAISYDIVKVGADYGSVFELINSKTFNEMVMAEDSPLEDIVRKYTDLIKTVHATKMNPGDFPSYKERYRLELNNIRGHLTDEMYERLDQMFADMPDDTNVIHGDIQMKNVMLADDEPMLIDMDTLGLGNILFEFAGLFVTYQAFEEDDPGNAMAFLGISQEKVDKIWELIIDYYFDFKDEDEKRRTLDKIALAGYVRFMSIIEITDLRNTELGQKRLAHSREHLEELLKRVDSVAI